MRYCDQCGVDVDQMLTICPLCGTAIHDRADAVSLPVRADTYPQVSDKPQKRESFPLLARLFVFSSIIICGVCALINILTYQGKPWCLYVVGGVLIAWLTIGLPLLSEMNINRMLITQMLGVCAYVWLIDWLSGGHGWAINYVCPFLYVLVLITVVIFALIYRIFWRDYLSSVVMVDLIGLIPALALIFKKVSVTWPSSVAVLSAIFLLAGLIIFASHKTLSELRRRMKF